MIVADRCFSPLIQFCHLGIIVKIIVPCALVLIVHINHPHQDKMLRAPNFCCNNQIGEVKAQLCQQKSQYYQRYIRKALLRPQGPQHGRRHIQRKR